MTVDEFAKVATVLAWPVFALLAFLLLFEPLHALLKRLSETLTFKSLKVKALGMETELTAEYARTVLHELLDDITESTSQLLREEVDLFLEILNAEGKKTVADYFGGTFVRDSPEHKRLQNLRDQKLIIPRQRSSWQSGKHPIVTPYGRLVAKLRTTASNKVQEFRAGASQ